MRRSILCGALALASIAITPAYARYDYQHNTGDSLVWRSEGNAIDLNSGNRYGIEVTDVYPAAVNLQMLRGQSIQPLTISAADYTRIVSPQPPQPPTPPTPRD